MEIIINILITCIIYFIVTFLFGLFLGYWFSRKDVKESVENLNKSLGGLGKAIADDFDRFIKRTFHK